ncbi:hypothetical protein C2W62_50095, partial [Candidatus Entotheonella serta]
AAGCFGSYGHGNTRRLGHASSPAARALNQRVEVFHLPAQTVAWYTALEPTSAATQPTWPDLRLDVGLFYEDREARPQPLVNGSTLRTGDGYRIYVEPYQPCYVYIFQIDSKGELTRLYPSADSGSHTVPGPVQGALWIPAPDRWFQLDNTQGLEEIYVVATQARREDVEDIFRRYTRMSRHAPAAPERRELT